MEKNQGMTRMDDLLTRLTPLPAKGVTLPCAKPFLRRQFARLAVMALVLSATANALEKCSFSRPLMGTTFSVVCYTQDRDAAEKAVHAAFAKAVEVNAVASDYDPLSEICRLSQKPVNTQHVVSPLLFELLAYSRWVAERTNGAFDPTLGPLTKLWRKTSATGLLPEPKHLALAREACGWKKFSLNAKGRTVTLHRTGMAFDLGGIAKGYAADLMVESLVAAGLPRVLVTAGGDVRMGDPPPNREGWNVAVKTFDARNTDEILTLANAAVSTSGDLHQSVEIAGVKYSHIIDPATGLGLTERSAATVIADQGKLSDALATAACVLGDKADAELKKFPGVREVKRKTLAAQ
jgi:thiamine biosynthesis lipoprotein